MTTNLVKYVSEHTSVFTTDQKVDDAVDMEFMKVQVRNDPNMSELTTLIQNHVSDFNKVDLFDGKEHGYIELGSWIGDQGLAIQLMAILFRLGKFRLLTPKIVVPDISDEFALELAGRGLITVTYTP